MATIEEFLNDSINSTEREFAKSVRNVRRDLDSEIDKIPGTGENLRANRATLSFSRKIIRDAPGIFDRRLSPAITSSIRVYDGIDEIVSDFLDDPEITGDNLREINDLKKLPIQFYERLTEETINDLNGLIQDHVLSGLSRSDLKEAFENSLLGVEDRRGTPMITHFNTLVHDGIMEYHARVNVISAGEAGVTNMKYVGSIIRDSRSFCVENAGRVFTLEEIQTLGSDFGPWRGKKSDNVLIDRGGFNCRHHWQPVVRR